ncbi:hypothetical protein OIM90_08155 [Streptomyces sp. AD16]|nr:hypothetical protein OIM90_08155 [Streptomyces sp. AD16]
MSLRSQVIKVGTLVAAGTLALAAPAGALAPTPRTPRRRTRRPSPPPRSTRAASSPRRG